MITEDQLSLMTAAIDAQLSDRERQALRELLASSAEAREVFARLKSDSDRLRSLPRLAPPAALQQHVMARIATLTPPFIAAPARRAEPATKPVPAPRRGTNWMPVAIAAALLIGVSGSSFWYFSRDNNTSSARNAERPPPATKRGAADPDWAKWLPTERSPASAPMPSEKRDNGHAVIDPKATVPPAPSHDIAIAPQPKLVSSDGLGFPPLPETRFDAVQVRLPFLKPLAEFEHEDIRHQLVEELGRDPAFRVDLFARNLARAIDTFKLAAKAEGLSLHIDSNATTLVKKGQATAVAIYTDSLSAVELADLFAKLNVEDAKVSPRGFDVLHASPIVRSDELELRSVLGTDPGLFKRTMPERRAPQGGKSVSDGTADHIVKSIAAGKGKSAVMLAWSPAQVRTLPASSAELKSFLSKRSERKPGAVPAVIVIRLGNG